MEKKNEINNGHNDYTVDHVGQITSVMRFEYIKCNDCSIDFHTIIAENSKQKPAGNSLSQHSNAH